MSTRGTARGRECGAGADDGGRVGCVRIAFGIFSPIISSKDLALAIREQYQPGDQVVATGLYENASTLNFYGGYRLLSLHAPGGNMWYGAQFPDAPSSLGDAGSFVRFVEWSGARFFVDRSG